MKKLIFTFILGLSICTVIAAQETPQSDALASPSESRNNTAKIGWAGFVKFGICQGFFTYSKAEYPPYYRENAIWQPAAGIGVQIPLQTYLALRPELTYAVKQFNYVPAQYNYSYYYYITKSLRVGHLSAALPVVGRIPIGNTSLYLGLGPYYSIALAGGKMRTTYYTNLNIDVDTEATQEHIKAQDYGMTALAGTSIRIGKVSVGIELNYQHGFENNYGEYDHYYFPDQKRYARSVGISFLLGTAKL